MHRKFVQHTKNRKDFTSNYVVLFFIIWFWFRSVYYFLNLKQKEYSLSLNNSYRRYDGMCIARIKTEIRYICQKSVQIVFVA